MLTESGVVWLVAAVAVVAIVLPYVLRFRQRVRHDRERKAEAGRLGIDRPVAQFPFVDDQLCIGCGACAAACPEGDVLGIVGGTAVVVNALRCVGHGRCEVACPVEALEVGLGDLKSRDDVPLLDDELQATVPGIYIAGELGGLALVRNATLQGRLAIEAIAASTTGRNGGDGSVVDVAIVGAGPAGLSAALTAKDRNLSYAVFEKESDLGGSVLHYPRRKMVLTQPVELPPWGRLEREEYQKEELLEIFKRMVSQTELDLRFGEAVEAVRHEEGLFRLRSSAGSELRARRVLLALGRRGSPRKLGVPGEELPKVMYRLIDAQSYRGERILVVGGGDSAAEAAIGLARQSGNQITLSYRKEKLVRLKSKNLLALEQLVDRGRVELLLSSRVDRIGSSYVELESGQGETLEIENDYVFVFAGGVPPFGFLQQIGIGFGGK